MKIKRTFKVNVANIPDELQPIVKDEMTRQEISMLGVIVLKMKVERFKNKLFGWWYERKNNKRENRK